MAKNKKSDEPPKINGGYSKDASNLIGVRTAKEGSAYAKALAPDLEGLNTPSYGSRKQQKGEEVEMNETQAIEYIQRIAGVDAQTAKEMNDAVWSWTDGSYHGIREVQQGRSSNEVHKKYGENIEKFLERATKWGGGVTYRGIDVYDIGYRVGDKIDMKGTSSWSTQESIARSFAGSSGSVFVSPTQSRGTSTNFSHQHHGEHEVTVSRKAKYIVDKIEKRGYRTYYFVHETS